MKVTERYQQKRKSLTIEEQIALGSGKSFWHTKEYEKANIPSIMVSDGPHGLRKQADAEDMLGISNSIPATCFPTAVSTGSSWDEELLTAIGRAIGEEAAENQVAVVLGPGLNMKRNPLCGRNFEYFSEDPYLAGKLGAAQVRGIQENGIGACLKHFAANSQEYKRFSSDSVMDERTLREIYLTAFEIAVKEAHPKTVMSAYNKLNGEYCSDSRKLLTEILREDWGFDGLVMTDWGGMSDRIKGFLAGCDLAMPGGSAFMEKEVIEAVGEERNEALLQAIQTSAERVIRLAVEQKAVLDTAKDFRFDREAHHELARKAAEESAVLLKNDEDFLPITDFSDTLFIGPMAKKIRYQGSGSSRINPIRLSNVLDANGETIWYVAGCAENGTSETELLTEAVCEASKAKNVVLFAGLTEVYESEGFDRENMKMPEGHLKLIEAVTAVNPNVAVVLMCGSPVEMPWKDRVKSILYMGLPGQAGGEAISRLLSGASVPGGKLAETWPEKYEDCISSSRYSYGHRDAHYREGIYVGYRYYDKAGVSPAYPFGHGLSYTEFTYENMEITAKDDEKWPVVKVRVRNTGKRAGAEVVQLYVASDGRGVHRPEKELKGFKKVWLEPGETAEVTFTLDERSFAVWQDGWKVPEGLYEILAGGSSRNLPLKEEFSVRNGMDPEIPSWQQGSWYETLKGIPKQEEWEEMLGRKVAEEFAEKGSYTMSNTVMEMKEDSSVMKILYKVLERMMAERNGGKVDYNNPEFRMMMATSADCSMRGMKINGQMNNHLLEGLLEMANGHFGKGLREILKK